MTNQPFHLVTQSPWPFIISFSLFNNLISVVAWFHGLKLILFISFPCTILCMIQWWRDVTRESTYQGFHTYWVYIGMRMGMILFIISEVMFFLSFFWAYFHSSLSPAIEIGQLWPPKG